LPQPLRAPYEKIRALLVGLSKPAKVLLISTLVIAVAITGGLSWRSSHEPYAMLYASLERDDAAALVAKLKEMKVPYKLGEGGASVEVPESRVHELRLELASAGLPRGGGVGFESFDTLKLGATEFEQHVLYRRALEGELTRTIATIGGVESSRVHLVMPERSAFLAQKEPASASIVVRLRPGKTLGASEVNGVVHLVASSVPGLVADAVTLVTTDGTMLHRPRKASANGDEDGDPEIDARTRSLEAQLEDRTRSMVEKIVGVGHADVRVRAELDPARTEHVEDHYDPAKSSLRSEEESTEHGETAAMPVAGVPGAESNLPNGAAPAPVGSTAAAAAGVVRESHTRNFEVDHVHDKRIASSGSLKRLTVAVVLDGVMVGEGAAAHAEKRSPEDMKALMGLVTSAVGADAARGDVVTVESMNFIDNPALALPEAPPLAAPAMRLDWKKYGPYGAGVIALAFAATFVALRRARARRLVARSESATVHLLGAGDATAAAIKALEAAPADVDVRALAVARAAEDPASAALVLRAWLGNTAEMPREGADADSASPLLREAS
jgi:flagellar M-ring protein FliF